MPYVRDDDLSTWIVFPSEQARRAYVQAAGAVRTLAGDADGRRWRLRMLVRALNGELRKEEPQG